MELDKSMEKTRAAELELVVGLELVAALAVELELVAVEADSTILVG